MSETPFHLIQQQRLVLRGQTARYPEGAPYGPECIPRSEESILNSLFRTFTALEVGRAVPPPVQIPEGGGVYGPTYAQEEPNGHLINPEDTDQILTVWITRNKPIEMGGLALSEVVIADHADPHRLGEEVPLATLFTRPSLVLAAYSPLLSVVKTPAEYGEILVESLASVVPAANAA